MAEAPKPDDEIEVTPEMIEAARSLLWDEQVSPWEDRDAVLVSIYRAMERARRRVRAQECGTDEPGCTIA